MNITEKINHKKEEYYQNFKKMPKVVVLHPDTLKSAISFLRADNDKDIYQSEYNTIYGMDVIESTHLRSDEVMVGG